VITECFADLSCCSQNFFYQEHFCFLNTSIIFKFHEAARASENVFVASHC